MLAMDWSNQKLVFECQIVGSWVNNEKLLELMFIRGKLISVKGNRCLSIKGAHGKHWISFCHGG